MSVDRIFRSQRDPYNGEGDWNPRPSTPELHVVEYGDHKFRYRTPQRSPPRFCRSVSPVMAERRTYTLSDAHAFPTHGSAHVSTQISTAHASRSNGDWRATAGRVPHVNPDPTSQPRTPLPAHPQVDIESAHHGFQLHPVSHASDHGRQSGYIRNRSYICTDRRQQ